MEAGVTTNKGSRTGVQLYLDWHFDLLIGDEQDQAILNQVIQDLPIFGDQTHAYDIQTIVQHTTACPKLIIPSPSGEVGPGVITHWSVFGI